MAKGITLTPAQIAERQHEIANTALGLFNEKGFGQTSMREIAEIVGMGKSSLYDFFTTKDEIFIFILEEKTDDLICETREIINLDLPPERCLRELMKANLTYNKENIGLLFWLRSEERFLASENQERVKKVHHDYQDMFVSVIEKGIIDGVFRKTDATLATRLLINSMLSIAYSSRPKHSMEEMLDMSLDIFLHGITV